MKKRYNILLVVALLLGTKHIAQLNLIDTQTHNIATPEVANLMKYSDFPSSGHIGKTDISIPLYTIDFGRIQLPIALYYNTKGNKVADIATSVGLGWNLTAGGNLTVKVNDMNDFTESYSYYTTATFEPELSLEWYRQSKGYLSRQYPLVASDINGIGLCINNKIGSGDDFFIDAAPDFYYINAPGFNDKFYLSQNDIVEYYDIPQYTAHFFKSTNAKLTNIIKLTPRINCASFESTGFGNKGRAGVYYQIDKFEIVGENGYIYTFNDWEGAVLTEYPQSIISHDAFQVNNWYLTKIKDPYSGKEINFSYESYSNNYEHTSLTTLGDINFGNYPMAYNYELGSMISNFIYPYVYNKVTTSKLYPKRIKKITTEEEVVEFEYSLKRIDYSGNALTSINVKNKNGNIIKRTSFNYDYFNSLDCSGGDYECKRLKLTTITDSNVGTYNFYYDSNTFPPRSSSKVDFLGYYNGNDSNIIFSKNNFHENEHYYPGTKLYFYPELIKDQIFPFPLTSKTPYQITEGIDRTSKIISKLGLLKKIVYPTGGFLKINYENDDFIYEGETYILGSTRVNNMKLYDSQNIVSQEINYKYINDDNKSSGQINFLTPPANSARTEISSGIGFGSDAIVGYSRILEEVVGKGHIERKYTNFSDYPDKLMTSDYNFSDQKTKNFLKILKFPSSYIQSFEERTGKLICENYYEDGLVNPVRKISYSYDYQVKDSLKVQKAFTSYDVYSHDFINSFTASNYLLRYFNNISTMTQENFFLENNIKEQSFFSYAENRLTYKKTLANGNLREEYYRNAKDKAVQKLVEANILDRYIEVEKKNNGKTVSKLEVKYENIKNIFPSSELSYNTTTNIMETNVNYDKYDIKGNLLQYTAQAGVSTAIIWGYNQTQPIARIEGATYEQVSALALDIIAASDADALQAPGNDETTLRELLDTFRKKLPAHQVTTYTYDPLIGVRSITPPSGLREVYEYDSAGRLKSVKDREGRELKKYEYHYKTP